MSIIEHNVVINYKARSSLFRNNKLGRFSLFSIHTNFECARSTAIRRNKPMSTACSFPSSTWFELSFVIPHGLQNQRICMAVVRSHNPFLVYISRQTNLISAVEPVQRAWHACRGIKPWPKVRGKHTHLKKYKRIARRCSWLTSLQRHRAHQCEKLKAHMEISLNRDILKENENFSAGLFRGEHHKCAQKSRKLTVYEWKHISPRFFDFCHRTYECNKDTHFKSPWPCCA